MSIITVDNLRKHYGDVPLRKPLAGRQSPIDYSRAASLLGYEPQHSWKEWVR